MVDGYCSDCTRTFATGQLPDELTRAYEVCLEAQLAGLEAVRPGASGPGVDAAARDKIETAGFGEAFGHGLGHGVGLLVHEDPRLAQESRSILAEGNVVTVEPGIYLSGLGGIRIEDLVIVREDGPEILTTFSKDLLTLDEAPLTAPTIRSAGFAGTAFQAWLRPSTRTSSRTGCTSRSTAASGASSSFST